MNSYPLSERKLAPYCRGIWDENLQKFIDSNSLQVRKCCLDMCKNHIDYCFDTCNQTYHDDFWQNTRCKDKCSQLEKGCKEGCMIIYSEGLKITNDCSENHGCGYFDKECIEKNKDNIIDCCKNNCILNCDTNLCHDFYDNFLENTESIVIIDELARNENNLPQNKHVSHAILIILGILGIIILVIILRFK